MEVFNSFVEWFNGLVGLQYAGYGPITAIFIGMLSVMISIRLVKYLLKPFAPLFQAAEGIDESNPVLAQQGIRQSQLMDHNEPLLAANDAAEMDFGEALEEAWQDDQSAELREEIAPLRPSRASANRAERDRADTGSALSNLRPTATAATQPAVSGAVPIICLTDFGENSRSSGAAHRIALRLGQGMSETLSRIPNLAVETAATPNEASDGLGPVFVVEGSVEIQSGGVHVSVAVRSSADGSHLLANETTCNPAELQGFEREVALEIASAVIAHQRPAGRSIMSRLKSSRGARAGSKYPSGRRPSPEHLHRTDLPAQ